MRVIFALLVLLNVAYLAYQQLFAVPLSSSSAEAQVVEPGRASRPRDMPPAGSRLGAASPGAGGGEATSDPPRSLAPGDAAAALDKVAGIAKPTHPVTEAKGALAIEGESQPTQLPANKAPIRRCTLIGPFASKVVAQSLHAELQEQGLEVQIETSKPGSLPDYLVYVGPASDRIAARELMTQFQDRSIDSYLIDKGSFENAISLGMFTRRPFALALQAKVRNQGYDAKISQIPRKREGYQLRADLPARVHQALRDDDNPLQDCESDASA